MRSPINVIYSCHHGCCGNPSFNTLTSVKAVWIPIACPLMHISVSLHAVHMLKHTETINSLRHTRAHTHTRRIVQRTQHSSPKPKELV